MKGTARDKGLWQTAEMVCVICSKEWVAVFPVEAPKLECPNCGFMNKAPV